MGRRWQVLENLWATATLTVFFQLTVATSAYGSVDVCDQAARNASIESGVPFDVLRAISRTETGRAIEGQLAPWPWTVNVDGTGYWFASESEATEFVEQRRNAGALNIDVGCFQINMRWHGDSFGSIAEMFSPARNALHAAKYLNQMFRLRGDWLSAVGAYHSKTEIHAERYLARYSKILADLPGQGLPGRSFFYSPAAPLLEGRAGMRPSGSLVPLQKKSRSGAFIRF